MSSRGVFTKRLFFIAVLISSFSFSQGEGKAKKKNILQFLGGELPARSITFIPGGTHLNNKDFIAIWYVGVHYKIVEYMVFQNSFGDLTAGVLYKRTLPISNFFSVNYGAGLTVGYKGNLKNHPEIPLSDTFLYRGTINPIVGIDVNIHLTKKIALQASLASWVLIYGVKYYF